MGGVALSWKLTGMDPLGLGVDCVESKFGFCVYSVSLLCFVLHVANGNVNVLPLCKEMHVEKESMVLWVYVFKLFCSHYSSQCLVSFRSQECKLPCLFQNIHLFSSFTLLLASCVFDNLPYSPLL